MLFFFQNELIFLIHVTVVISFLLYALSRGHHALTSTICLYGVLANLFVTQQITLFGMHVTSSDVFAVGGILGLNILQEFFGKKHALRAIIISFSTAIVYLVLCMIHLAYIPNSFDIMRPHFTAVLTPMPRIIIASVIVYLLVQAFDTVLYGALKKICANRYLTLRTLASLCIAQLLDTILFSFAGLYGTVNSITDVIIVSFSIKVMVIICSAPFIECSKFFFKTGTTDHESF